MHTAGTKRDAAGAAFTLVELLVVVAILGVLVAIALPALAAARASSARAISAHSLKQLAVGGNFYLAEHDGAFWPFAEYGVDGGTQWWFGWESGESLARPEGERTLDLTRGPLGPYAAAAGGVKTDPALAAFRPRLKPKYRDGNYGYGYNTLLVGQNARWFARPADLVMFATCAQVNTFQAPASARNPMVEEFYMINDKEITVHFRHGGRALAAFLDGSVREVEMKPDTLDQRMPSAKIGCLADMEIKLHLNQ